MQYTVSARDLQLIKEALGTKIRLLRSYINPDRGLEIEIACYEALLAKIEAMILSL
ncbi:MAG: hypothetical protein IJS66_04655 [Bacteroidales bacterium]|nr:hypothetical protein [Bacteroidales bacterium]